MISSTFTSVGGVSSSIGISDTGSSTCTGVSLMISSTALSETDDVVGATATFSFGADTTGVTTGVDGLLPKYFCLQQHLMFYHNTFDRTLRFLYLYLIRSKHHQIQMYQPSPC